MRHKKWLVISLLIGTVLLMSIASSNVLYTDAVLQRVLTKDLEATLIETNRYPFFIRMQETNAIDGRQSSQARIASLQRRAEEIPEVFDIPLEEQVQIFQSRLLSFVPELSREDKGSFSLQLTDMSQLDEHIELISGSTMTNLDATGAMDVIVSEAALLKHDLLLGEVLELSEQNYLQGSFRAASGETLDSIHVRIAGVFEAEDLNEPYWYRTPSYYADSLFVHPDFMDEHFLHAEEALSSYTALFYTMPDYTELQAQNVPQTLQHLDELFVYMGSNNQNFHENVSDQLLAYQITEQQVRMTLALLQIPMVLLLLAFILMVSGQLIAMEADEIAVFKSRGSSRAQIIGIYTLQGLIIAGLSALLAVPLSFFMTQVLGSSSEFLRFVQREALPLRLSPNYIVTIVAAGLLSLLTMTIPAFRSSKISIVESKQRRRRKPKLPLWQLIGLDIILLGVALYALYSFNRVKDSLSFQIAQGESPDALLFLASSVFMLGAALLAWRIIPWLIRGIYVLVKRFVGPALYASFLQITRGGNSQGFITVFLILTVAMGIFNAVAARSINSNGERDIYYRNGADLVVQESWQSNAELVAQDPSIELVYTEPDFSAFSQVPAVESFTRVYSNSQFSVRRSNVNLNNVKVMGIHTKEFGETATPVTGLLPEHLNHYLNRMAADPRAVLLSENFRTVLDLEVGDVLNYRSNEGVTMTGVIAGFVPYFPSYQPRTLEIGDDGQTVTSDNYLIVSHLAEIQQQVGLRPYELWFRTNDNNEFIYEFAEETGRRFTRFNDSYADLIAMRNDPSFQGTNGILTVSFVVVLMLSATGFLIYWILSIRARTLTFGIQRAMGLSMFQVLSQLINEQLFVTVPALLAGSVIGILGSRLYVPLIQTAYAAADQTLPIRVEEVGSDILRMALLILAVIVLCITILGVMVRRMKITQALKLGED